MNHFDFEITPIEKLGYFSKKWNVDLLCKRDDLFSKAGGGSKARMLQYILFGLNKSNCDVLVTAGGPNSNFNRACALMCAQLGITMHLVEYTDEPIQFESSLNYYVCKLAGVRTTRCEKKDVPQTIEEVLNQYKGKGVKVSYIYGGGKSLQGFFAYYDAVQELYNQGMRDLDYVFVACGTGTTLTGICAGMQKYYPKAQVHGISVARNNEDEMPVLQDDIKQLNDFLHASYDFKNLILHDEFLCGGYSHATEELKSIVRECISHEGIVIDPTYSGKAFYGMSSIIKDSTGFDYKKILFWNTGGIFNLLSDRSLWI